MKGEDDTISWQEFVDDPTIAVNTRCIRKMVIGALAKANGFESPTLLLDKIRLDKDKPNTDDGKLTPYRASRKYVFGLIAPEQENGNGNGTKRLKSNSVKLYRSVLPTFFKSVLGEQNFSNDTFDRMVKIGDTFVEIEKKAPTTEELKHLLAIANPRDRALLGVLCTGMRITEAITRKMKEIQQRGEYYFFKLKAGETKMRYKRRVPITAETFAWIQAYHTDVNSEWIFPSREGMDKPMTRFAAWDALKNLFERGGLKDSEDGSEIYSPHSMRKFAENYMLRCGLADKFTDAIVGHVGKLGAKTHYLDDDETTDSWFEMCADKMTWSQDIVRIVELPKDAKDKMEQQDRRINKLEVMLVRNELARIAGAGATLSSKEKVDAIIGAFETLSPDTPIGEAADREAKALLENKSATEEDKKEIERLIQYLSKRNPLQFSPSEAKRLEAKKQ
jgi:site-specific recombinase XerD